MDIYSRSPDWKQNPIIVGLLMLFCFPFGLFLVWTHPEWAQRTKWIWTGCLVAFLGIGALRGESEKAEVAKRLDQADSQWASGQQAEAVAYYKLAADDQWLKIADETRPKVLSRIVEFHAEAGQDSEAKKWIEKADRHGISITTDSEKVTPLLAGMIKEPSTPVAESKSASSSSGSSNSKYELGKEFQLGDYKYTILRLERRQQIGNEFIGEKASPGAAFVVVTYTIENCSTSSQAVLSDDFNLIDAKGRTFTTSSKVSTALLAESDDKDFLLSELQPGLPRRMLQGFELPEASLGSHLILVVPKKGLLSYGDARLTVEAP